MTSQIFVTILQSRRLDRLSYRSQRQAAGL